MDTTSKMFNVLCDNGETKQAELISIFSKNDNEYAIYTIPKDSERSDLFAAKIIQDENNEDKLVEIDDINIKNEIVDMIKEMLKN